jgi:Fe-S cluster assembly ATPase SufC
MSVEQDSMPAPEAAINDTNSKEVLRAWVAENGMHFSFRSGQWPTEVWGVFLSDILRQVVAAEVEETKTDPKHVVRSIMDKLMDEVNQFGEELGFEEKNI